tara:strand:- start:53 stop:334 length:282 start_codon:yes stop_codon:yes gene_type:complete
MTLNDEIYEKFKPLFDMVKLYSIHKEKLDMRGFVAISYDIERLKKISIDYFDDENDEKQKNINDKAVEIKSYIISVINDVDYLICPPPYVVSS